VQARVWEIGAPGDGPLSVVVSSPNGELAYSLDVTDFLRPTVTNVAAATNFRQSHDHLADEGLVQHRLGDQLPEAHWRVLVYETAPDGNSPDLALAFEMNPLVSQQSHD
jgi:hypothetical protein